MIKNVLIIEDSKPALEMLQQIVEEIGTEVKVYKASNSLEAYQKAVQYTIDVFLIDIILDTTKREEDKNLFFRKDGLLFAVNVAEIVYIENSAHRLVIQTIDEKMKMPYKSCKNLMEEIDSRDFLQCSRSTIVNTKYVTALDSVNRYLILKENFGNLDIGIAYLKKVKEYFQMRE